MKFILHVFFDNSCSSLVRRQKLKKMNEQTNKYHLGVLKGPGDMVLRHKSETKDPYNLEGENRRGKVMQ